MIRRILLSLPPSGWLLILTPIILAFFYLPLAFGGTTPASVHVFDQLVLLTFVLWVLRLVFTRSRTLIPGLVVPPLLLLGALGFCHAINPKYEFVRESWNLVEIPDAHSFLPGTLDRATTLPLLWHFGALALGFLVLVDAVSRPEIRWFLLRVIALAGAIIALTGILQRASGAEAMLWVGPEQSGKLFFGAFRYNANAAAFLNLSWPAALVVWLRSRIESSDGRGNPFDLFVLFFLTAAIFVNTSKAGQILGLIGILLAIFWFWRSLKPVNTSRAVTLILSLLFLSLFAIVLLPAISLVGMRWEAATHSFSGRLLLYEVSSKIISDSGWFGYGPGSFRIAFPFYTNYLGDRLSGMYTHAHQDYLQTIIEWGYLGFLAWVFLIGGGLWIAIQKAWERRSQSRTDLSASGAALALILVLIHAFADFPLQIPAIQWLVAFYVAIGWAEFQSLVRRKKRRAAGTRPKLEDLSDKARVNSPSLRILSRTS